MQTFKLHVHPHKHRIFNRTPNYSRSTWKYSAAWALSKTVNVDRFNFIRQIRSRIDNGRYHKVGIVRERSKKWWRHSKFIVRLMAARFYCCYTVAPSFHIFLTFCVYARLFGIVRLNVRVKCGDKLYKSGIVFRIYSEIHKFQHLKASLSGYNRVFRTSRIYKRDPGWMVQF